MFAAMGTATTAMVTMAIKTTRTAAGEMEEVIVAGV
jgi:hypothetical protein